MSRIKSASKSVTAGSPRPAISEPNAATRPPAREPSDKKLKSYRLSERKIAAAQEVLGAPNATAAIEAALDMVLFRQELIQGTGALFGIEISPYDIHGR